jgi:creatinine amidohydrolase
MKFDLLGETMAQLNWVDLEQAAKGNCLVLFPISVIEEHGPHMNLAVDTIVAQALAKEVRNKLQENGHQALIAPPLYWGINSMTSTFPGSFSLSPQTFSAVICDTISCLKSWGFKNTVLFTTHGDIEHIKTMAVAAKEAHGTLDTNTKCIATLGQARSYLGYTGNEQHILPIEGAFPPWSDSEFIDIHAGALETSLMAYLSPESVNLEQARELNDSNIAPEQISNWNGENAKQMTPYGYCGNPSDIDIEKAKRMFDNWAKLISDALEGSYFSEE